MRKISIVVDSRTNWAKAKSICQAVKDHPDLELSLAVCSVQSRNWQDYMDGWKPDHVLDTYHDSAPGTTFGMVEQSANLMLALASYYNSAKPDVVIALTDRYETLCVAQVAALMNIHVAHVQGGEVTGTIDESIRHAVTKLSHIHFPATYRARKKIISMGEDPKFVYFVGCPASDILLQTDTYLFHMQDYILFMMHPVTTELYDNYENTVTAIKATRKAWDGELIAIGPNHDAGYLEVEKALRDEMVTVDNTHTHEHFIKLMANAKVLVGNSSAGIREACYFGTPVVDIGSRQYNRQHGSNVYHAEPSFWSIEQGIRHQKNKKYPIEYIYGDGKAGKNIADILSIIDLPPIQKRLHT